MKREGVSVRRYGIVVPLVVYGGMRGWAVQRARAAYVRRSQLLARNANGRTAVRVPSLRGKIEIRIYVEIFQIGVVRNLS